MTLERRTSFGEEWLQYKNERLKAGADEYCGKTIQRATLNTDADPNRLEITFEDGTKIAIWDDGQSCCERRYMTTDDDPHCLVGKKLTKVELKAHKEENRRGRVQHTVFVEIAAEDEHIIIVNHNEHNGNYGGFDLTITEDKRARRRHARRSSRQG